MDRRERSADSLRAVLLTKGFVGQAEGSVLVEFGRTRVICTASVEDRVPSFLRGTGQGWVTAEYGMLPRSTNTRMDREAARGKQSGRTQEIQRLIGRSLRSAISLQDLGEKTIKIDCDVIEADGGTRTADYSEDSSCDTDLNLVMTEAGDIIEIQGTAEGVAFNKTQLSQMLDVGEKGIVELIAIQKKCLDIDA